MLNQKSTTMSDLTLGHYISTIMIAAGFQLLTGICLRNQFACLFSVAFLFLGFLFGTPLLLLQLLLNKLLILRARQIKLQWKLIATTSFLFSLIIVNLLEFPIIGFYFFSTDSTLLAQLSLGILPVSTLISGIRVLLKIDRMVIEQ